MSRYPYPRRPRKPRPVAEIEADLERVDRAMNTRPTQYNANHYDRQRMLLRDMVELRAELRRAQALYGTPEPAPTPDTGEDA